MISATNLSTITTAVQAVEQIATEAADQSLATGPQKLAAAVSFVTALDPAIGIEASLLETLINAVVSTLNSFGVFKKVPVAGVTS
jgi:hypothetical protein